MKRKFNISKKFIIRVLMLLLVLTGAMIFDACYDQLPAQLAAHQNEAGKHKLDSQVYFYNPVSNFKIRTGTDKLFSKILFTIGQNKFLASFHNQKASDLIKAEALKVCYPISPMIYFRKFIICHHSGSEDYYLLS